MRRTARLVDSYWDESEDRAEIVTLSEEEIVFLVADGVGGRENGGPAASRAIELAKKAVIAASPRQRTDPRFYTRMLHDIDDALERDATCGQTTLVVVCLTPKQIAGASVGDSEAWWVAADGKHVTLTSEEARKPYLGAAMAKPAPISAPTPRSGTLLVATDGLFKYAYLGPILEIVTKGGEELSEIAVTLRNAARGSSGRLYDDFAVLLAR